MRFRFPHLVALFLAATAARSAAAQVHLREQFEGPEPSWQWLDSDVRHRLPIHRRTAGGAHSGSSCEQVRVEAGNGSYVHLRHPVRPLALIDELRASLWVRSDRSGLQLSARVVLPHATEARSGEPFRLIVGNATYSQPGRWQRLELVRLPDLLRSRLNLERIERRRELDLREAYVDGLVLNVYGGPGVTNVLIDDLELFGVAQRPQHGARQEPDARAVRPVANLEPQPRQEGVALRGSVLLDQRQPVFPRVIEHRGEALELLDGLGFNVVQLASLPTDAQIAEAERLGLGLVCPPPEPRALHASPERFGRVLAWDLGCGFTRADLDRIRRTAEEVRRHDPVEDRPLICNALCDLRPLSRHVNMLNVRRSPMGTSLELKDYVTWIRQRPRLARPGTPTWTTIDTQPNANLRSQQSLLGAAPPETAGAPPELLRLMALSAVAAGSRGIVFRSHSRLDAGDPQTQQRARALHLINLELDLVQPWAGSGKVIGQMATSDPQITAFVLEADRARLVLPMWLGQAAQIVPGQSVSGNVSFLVPGVPESYDAYEVSPAGLKDLPHQRVTGGIQVRLRNFGAASLVVLTQDPTVLHYLSNQLRKISPQAAQLQRYLSDVELKQIEAVLAELERYHRVLPQARSMVDAARAELRRCDQHLSSRDYRTAYFHARTAMRPLSLLERMHWQEASEALEEPLADPLAIGFGTLPEHWKFVDSLRGLNSSGNMLAGGDFESLERAVRSGWRHVKHPQPGVQTEAEVAREAAYTNDSGLRLVSEPTEPDAVPEMVESPPVWVTSAPVRVEAGQLVRIQGWVNVPGPITGSVDGLMVLDSLSGEALAARFGMTSGWEHFVLYRVAPERGFLTVTFALSGLGEAWIDDVMIEALGPPGREGNGQARRLPGTYEAGGKGYR